MGEIKALMHVNYVIPVFFPSFVLSLNRLMEKSEKNLPQKLPKSFFIQKWRIFGGTKILTIHSNDALSVSYTHLTLPTKRIV